MTDPKVESNYVPPFVLKLEQAVSDPSTDDIISWKYNDDGTVFEPHSLVIWDRQRFVKEILPQYYKGSKFCSFVRQMNAYNFEYVGKSKGSEYSTFFHNYFRKDEQSLYNKIERRKSEKRKNVTSPAISTSSLSGIEDDDKIQSNTFSTIPLASTLSPDPDLKVNSNVNILSQEIRRLQAQNSELKIANQSVVHDFERSELLLKQAVSTLWEVHEKALRLGNGGSIVESIENFHQTQQILSFNSQVGSSSTSDTDSPERSNKSANLSDVNSSKAKSALFSGDISSVIGSKYISNSNNTDENEFVSDISKIIESNYSDDTSNRTDDSFLDDFLVNDILPSDKIDLAKVSSDEHNDHGILQNFALESEFSEKCNASCPNETSKCS